MSTAPLKPSQVLRLAKSKIVDPSCWTTKAYYRDNFDNECGQQNASCFCSYGALRVANNKDTDFNLIGTIYLEEAINGGIANEDEYQGIADYNDFHTHSEVMVMWDRAISLAELEETKEKE